jgi:hypothetical protein
VASIRHRGGEGRGQGRSPVVEQRSNASLLVLHDFGRLVVR